MTVGSASELKPMDARSPEQPWVTFVTTAEREEFVHAVCEQRPVNQLLRGVTREVLLPARARGIRPAALRQSASLEEATAARVDWQPEDKLEPGWIDRVRT